MAKTKPTKSQKKTGSKTRKRTRKSAIERVFEGLGVSPGVAVGKAYLRESNEVQVVEYQVTASGVDAEIARFEGAVSRAQHQLEKLQKRAANLHGAASEELGYLLEAHFQMLGSSRLLGGVEARIRKVKQNAEAAVMGEIVKIAESFEQMDDPYLRGRATEIREVGWRVVRNLSDQGFTSFADLDANSIVLAEEITPADTALMDPSKIGGFATALGGAEGHTAIMARSLGIPAVLGITDLFGTIQPGDIVIIDGSNGVVVVNPKPARLRQYAARQKALAREVKALARLRDVPAVTRDGQRISLQANMELPREVGQVVAAGAEGVGLLRTEFLYMNREDLPDEEEQFDVLRHIVDGLGGRLLTVRTIDVGGDKLGSAFGREIEESTNPALGLRAIRLSLKERALLETQLAAMLRAAAYGPLRILLPMISTVSEVREVREVMKKVVRRLKRRGVKLPDPLPPLGVMIEVPGAALAADALAKESDFFALGTNDLTMYTLAIDRAEEGVAHLYNPLHPGVLRLIQFSVEAGLRARLPISICGEMAGDPRYTALFLGMGVRDLSMTANALPRVKNRILGIDLQEATRRASMIMDQVDSGRIAALLDDFNALA